MLGYADLYNCDTSAFGKDAAKWQGLATALSQRGDEIQTALTGLNSWTGAAANAAKAEFGTHRQQFATMAITVGKIPPVLTGLAQQIGQLQTKPRHQRRRQTTTRLDQRAPRRHQRHRTTRFPPPPTENNPRSCSASTPQATTKPSSPWETPTPRATSPPSFPAPAPGVGVTNADQLHLDGVPADQVGQHVHSTVAQHDPINLAVGINGPPPTGPSFGGTTFTSDPGTPGPWYEFGWNAAVHSEYWDQGNKALVNMGNIVAGKPTF
jgi:hypothetical protein